MKRTKDLVSYLGVGLILLRDDKEMWQALAITAVAATTFFVGVNFFLVN